MSGCPEYRYWEKDNDKLELKDEMLPSWIATLNALEALLSDMKRLYPELDIYVENEDIDPQF